TIILLIGFVVSDTHILYGVFIVLIGIVLLRLFKINLLSFKKLTMSQVIYIIGGALLIYGLDHLYLHFHDVPTNEQELDRELQHMPLYMS
ncbi:CPBP family intramembrane glutamate endopeptidase, partial [Staphylococcus aureus]